MTKRIRVENADCNRDHRVQVHHQELSAEGWVTVRIDELHVTQLSEITIHSHKRFIVEEMPSGPMSDAELAA